MGVYSMRPWSCSMVVAALLLLLPFSDAATTGTPQYSQLWGKASELWDHGPRGRIPDWSHAGYKGGAELPPTASKLRATVDVTRFGADAKGRRDSLPAIEAAVQSSACRNAAQCVVYFPPGNYLMDGNLTIQQPVILRGAGRDSTTLSFSQSWSDITGEWAPRMWSFGPGLLHFHGQDQTTGGTRQVAASFATLAAGTSSFKPPLLAGLVRDAARGDQRLYVDSTSRLRAGQWVRIVAQDPGVPGACVSPTSTPLAYYMLGQAGAIMNISDLLWPNGGNRPRDLLDLLVQITAVGRSWVVLDRRLPVALSAGWREVGLRPVTATGMRGKVMGIEDLTVQLPSSTRYPGHFQEEGYNAVQFTNAANCFARNLRVKNADDSLTCWSCFQCSFMNVLIEADRKPNAAGAYGHHGIWLARGGNNLVTDFTVNASQVHDLSLDSNTALNVFRNGAGVNLNIDFHKLAPHSNLFTNLDMGLGRRPFASGGESARGPHAAIFNTVWNIRASGGGRLQLPCEGRYKKAYGCGVFGPYLNFVGANIANGTAVPTGWWVENIPSNRLVPSDLYTAQVQMRLGKAMYSNQLPVIPVQPPVAMLPGGSSSSSSGGSGSGGSGGRRSNSSSSSSKGGRPRSHDDDDDEEEEEGDDEDCRDKGSSRPQSSKPPRNTSSSSSSSGRRRKCDDGDEDDCHEMTSSLLRSSPPPRNSTKAKVKARSYARVQRPASEWLEELLEWLD